MKGLKKPLCILCAVILLSAFMPAGVFATDSEPKQTCKSSTVYNTDAQNIVDMRYAAKERTEPTFRQNGLQLIVGNLKGVKDIRTAYGEYSSISEIKKADTHRAFTANGTIKDRDEYTIQYREEGAVTVAVRYENGYIKFHSCYIKTKAPVISRDGNQITFVKLDGLNFIRYVRGVYTTLAQIKAAPDSKELTSYDVVKDSVTVDLEAGIYSFCVRYDDGSCKYYIILAQDEEENTPKEGGFSKHYEFTDENGDRVDSLNYWMYTPVGACADMPLIVVLHSANVKAKDSLTDEENLDYMVSSSYDDIPKYLYDGELDSIPAYIVMPQTNGASRGWSKRSSELIALVEYMKREYSINRDKISVIGYSMGGTGAVELAYAYPDTFTRVLSIAGGLDGVTNNTRPCIGGARISLDGYPELRVLKSGSTSQYDSETIKYLYDNEESRYLAVTEDEKAQARAFRRDRTTGAAKCFNRNRVSLWAITGGADVEVKSEILKGICNRMNSALTRCDVYPGYSHSKLSKLWPDLEDEIIRYLLDG